MNGFALALLRVGVFEYNLYALGAFPAVGASVKRALPDITSNKKPLKTRMYSEQKIRTGTRERWPIKPGSAVAEFVVLSSGRLGGVCVMLT
jgi:hypothetical protein